jgi:hypothetical protein
VDLLINVVGDANTQCDGQQRSSSQSDGKKREVCLDWKQGQLIVAHLLFGILEVAQVF